MVSSRCAVQVSIADCVSLNYLPQVKRASTVVGAPLPTAFLIHVTARHTSEPPHPLLVVTPIPTVPTEKKQVKLLVPPNHPSTGVGGQ